MPGEKQGRGETAWTEGDSRLRHVSDSQQGRRALLPGSPEVTGSCDSRRWSLSGTRALGGDGDRDAASAVTPSSPPLPARRLPGAFRLPGWMFPLCSPAGGWDAWASPAWRRAARAPLFHLFGVSTLPGVDQEGSDTLSKPQHPHRIHRERHPGLVVVPNHSDGDQVLVRYPASPPSGTFLAAQGIGVNVLSVMATAQ